MKKYLLIFAAFILLAGTGFAQKSGETTLSGQAYFADSKPGEVIIKLTDLKIATGKPGTLTEGEANIMFSVADASDAVKSMTILWDRMTDNTRADLTAAKTVLVEQDIVIKGEPENDGGTAKSYTLKKGSYTIVKPKTRNRNALYSVRF